jgi:hypothetical protein
MTYEFRWSLCIPEGGDQTWEEMMGNWFGLLIDRTIDPNDVMKPLGTSSVFGRGEEG